MRTALPCLRPFTRPLWVPTGSTFPSVAASNTTSIGSNTTSHAVNLPTGIVSGDLLLVWFRTGNTTVDHTAAGGWTELVTGAPNANGRTTLFYRVADGSEGSTATFTSGGLRKSAAIALRVTGQGTHPAYAAGAGATSLDPASHTDTGGSAKHLWLALCSSRQTINITAAPTNYSGLIVAASTTIGGTDNTEAIVAIATRQYESDTDDPDSFTAASSNNPFSRVISIHP